LFTDNPFPHADPVAAQANTQVFGFADIKQQTSGILHQVNAGALCQFSEEIMAQPLDQWSRIGEQQCL
jgi:hypothetical protein